MHLKLKWIIIAFLTFINDETGMDARFKWLSTIGDINTYDEDTLSREVDSGGIAYTTLHPSALIGNNLQIFRQ